MEPIKRTHILAARFREVMLSGTWIANTNFKHQLSDVDWKLAVAKHHDANTIALLAQHIHYYMKGISQVISGGTLDIKDQYSFAFAPIDSEIKWQSFLAQLWNDATTFANLVEQLPDEKLDAAFVDEKYGTYQRNIDGMIEHAYYHLGQVVLLKKLLSHNQ